MNSGSEAGRPEVGGRVVSSESCSLASVPELDQERIQSQALEQGSDS